MRSSWLDTVIGAFCVLAASGYSPGGSTSPDEGSAAGALVSEGRIIAIDPPHRIEFTFTALWDEKLTAEGPCRKVWSIRDVNGMTELTIELWDIAVGGPTYEDFVQGLPSIVSGLKSLLETGEALPLPS